jgi:hypothetical protein
MLSATLNVKIQMRVSHKSAETQKHSQHNFLPVGVVDFLAAKSKYHVN